MIKRDVSFSVPFEVDMLPVILSGLERTSEAFGLDDRGRLALNLAVEEVFSFIASGKKVDERMEVVCRDGGYYVEVDCRVPRKTIPLKAFNMTSSIESDNLDSMGLVLASRTTDRFSLYIDRGDRATLSFIKRKVYDEFYTPCYYPDDGDDFTVDKVEKDDWPSLLTLVRDKYGLIGDDFKYPGLMASMVEAGDLFALAARDGKGRLGGFILWSLVGNIASLQGPFALYDEIERALLDNTISILGKEKAAGVTVSDPVENFPLGYFEDFTGDGKNLFRYLSEDNGGVSWATDSIVNFMTDFYDRADIPRDVKLCSSKWQEIPENSLLSVCLDHSINKAVLKPLVTGDDSSSNLKAHMDMLKERGYEDIQLELDVGVPQMALFAEAAIAAAFKPKRIVPWGGKGDILIMEPSV